MHTSAEVGSPCLERLGSTALDHYWEKIEVELDAEPELWNRSYSKEELHSAILAGHVQVFAVADEECIRIVFFTRALVDPDQSAMTLHLFWMRGVGLLEFLPLINLALDDVAQQFGCEKVRITGRKGFERVLKPLGARHLYSTFERAVSARKGN